ncbi:MAG: flagellar filament outer layer protein FlaA [Spirochaetales bacterium]|nr:flagellar filament outer layer protein FlaA [Spirochaetales bacterium]
MKKLCIVLGIVLLVAGTAFADKSVLIDFSTLVPDVTVGPTEEPNEHEATLMDYADVAGASYDEDIKKQMKSSLAIENWYVQLASSARTVENQTLSMTKMAPLKPDAKPFNNEEMGGLIVLGVRVHFPLPSFNSYALILPPFEIPAYQVKQELRGDELIDLEDPEGSKFDGYGVVKNVGVLKSVEVTVYGSNFPNGVGVLLKDQDGKEQTIFMDYLDFDGWRKLVWNNPNYITEVRNREVRKYPLYPNNEPFVKLMGLIIYRDSMQAGGDIITYFKDIQVTYDKALLEVRRDFDDEAIWGILKVRQEARKQAELRRLGELQVLRTLEKQKMHKEEE